MSIFLYLSISVLGLLLTQFLSERYWVSKRLVFLFIYLFVFVNFSVQHYTILFDKMFFNNWLFVIPVSDDNVSSLFRFLGGVFLFLEVLTVPKSKFGLAFIKLFKLMNQ